MISDVYGDRLASGAGRDEANTFPLQQKILVCSLLLLTRQQKTKEVTLGKVSVQILSAPQPLQIATASVLCHSYLARSFALQHKGSSLKTRVLGSTKEEVHKEFL